MRPSSTQLAVILSLGVTAGCTGAQTRTMPQVATLKDAFASSFVVGAAINGRQIDGADSVGGGSDGHTTA